MSIAILYTRKQMWRRLQEVEDTKTKDFLGSVFLVGTRASQATNSDTWSAWTVSPPERDWKLFEVLVLISHFSDSRRTIITPRCSVWPRSEKPRITAEIVAIPPHALRILAVALPTSPLRSRARRNSCSNAQFPVQHDFHLIEHMIRLW